MLEEITCRVEAPGPCDPSTRGSCTEWREGEPNGRSDVGDEDSEDDNDDSRDGRDEIVGVGGMCAVVTVADRSRVALVNCPL